ncbi:MAG TPA: Lrp/AsnC family transcriptional regulator [Firmicutes bacterium]|nr:Lrp/AsnC family transcriptional regulator [Bacillota bacterium]
MEKMDPVDRKIVALLMENARLPIAEIARQVHLSRVAVRERLNRLVEEKVIQEFTAVVDGGALGYSIAAFFEIEVQPERLEAVAKELARREQVTIVYQMTGPTTLHVHAYLKDSKQLAVFLREHVYNIPGVVKVSTHLLLQRFKSVLSIR